MCIGGSKASEIQNQKRRGISKLVWLQGLWHPRASFKQDWRSMAFMSLLSKISDISSTADGSLQVNFFEGGWWLVWSGCKRSSHPCLASRWSFSERGLLLMAIKMEGNFASNLGLETKLIGNNFPSLETLQRDWEKLLKIAFKLVLLYHIGLREQTHQNPIKVPFQQFPNSRT